MNTYEIICQLNTILAEDYFPHGHDDWASQLDRMREGTFATMVYDALLYMLEEDKFPPSLLSKGVTREMFGDILYEVKNNTQLNNMLELMVDTAVEDYFKFHNWLTEQPHHDKMKEEIK